MKAKAEITLGNVSLVITANVEGEALQDMLNDGLANKAYRGFGSTVFKGVKDRSTVSYPDAAAKMKAEGAKLGWTIETSPYTPDSLKKEWEEMGRVIDAASAAKKLEKLLAQFGVSPKLPKDEMAKAIVAARKSQMDAFLK